MESEKVIKNEYGFYELKNKERGRELAQMFQNRYYQESMSVYRKEYSAKELQMYQIRNMETEYIIHKNAQMKEGMRFLDIGCGEGFARAYFLNKGYEVECLDLSMEGIKYHNKELLDRFRQGDARKILPGFIEEGKKYDVIHMRAVFDAMDAQDAVLGLIRQLLEDAGVMVIEVANNFSPLQLRLWEEKKVKEEYWLDNFRTYYFNKEGLIRFVEQYGFACVDFYADSLIDIGLVNDLTNYYEHPEIGKKNFEAYADTEQMLMDISLEKTMALKKILGDMGLGRTILAAFQNR